ncbi:MULTISPECIES: hypothetical protein [unclassified Saccharibacter]|uniref:hypothetical protein n=1 Tax=unclassified Saccharibacter TaxID=2648722 RepID=UPI00132BD2F6|nr:MULTISPECIES: hypothetical protein [unclassified Saccharibacter]MXV35869.1 hypothetical protein [Saccharibacter sp. EH611]MXV57989.1 hypothetical protein [Saccharibacter sp. EH70]MXV66384.1 hypothetical protein [Saccharibacter sp. EH60]
MSQSPFGPHVGLTWRSSFGGGIMSPLLGYRADMEKWQSGAADLTNFFVHVQGGISNRPGTRYIGTSRTKATSAPPKLIAFIYNNTQSYVLEFGDQYVRFISNGAYLTHDDGSLYELTTPYRIEDAFWLRHAQSADVLTLTHARYPAMNLARRGELDWTLDVISYDAGITAPSSLIASAVEGTAANTGTTPGVSKATYEYAVTSVSNEKNTESNATLAPSQTEMTTTIQTVTDATTGKTSTVQKDTPVEVGRFVENYNIGYYTNYGNYNTLTWPSVDGADYYNVYRRFAGQWGLIGNTASLSFDDVNYAPDTENGPPAHRNPFESGNNPVSVTYFQQRRVFAGAFTYPQTVWMSRSANYTNFDIHTPVVSDDAITATIASQQVNTIKHLVPMADLLAFTGTGIWKISGGQTGTAITPSNFTAVPQMFVGCSDVQPLAINTDVLFIENKGSHIRDLQYDWYAQIYQGNDLSVLSDHLFYGYTIADWSFAQFPFNLIWAVRSDGTLLGMTYLKEQNVTAWHQHTTHKGSFQSVAVVPEENGYGAIEDTTYVVVKRLLNGTERYMIERLETRQLGAENNDITRSWFVDCGLRYEGAPVATLSGLTHLAGETVSACVDGTAYTALTVRSDGSLTVPQSGRVITVGLPITATAKTLPLDLGQPPQFARRKRVSKVYATLYNSAGLSVSTNGGKTTHSLNNQGAAAGNAAPNPYRNTAQKPALTTGLAMRIPTPNWTQSGQITFQTTNPLPVTLSTVSVDVEVGS